uniref:uncharacterized protein isoform X1 n=1 Tax=Myxine glutinosa TaxID=7769 RepID=UPI00358E225B
MDLTRARYGLGPGPVPGPAWLKNQGLPEESLRAAITGLGIEIFGALCARAEPAPVRDRLCALSARKFPYTMYAELCRYMESVRAGRISERTFVPGCGGKEPGVPVISALVLQIKIEDEYPGLEEDERDPEDGKQEKAIAWFCCTLCSHTFNTKDALMRHRKRHQPVSSDEACYETTLVNHTLIHAKERPYTCSMCGLCIYNSIRMFEEQRREHHLQVLIDDAVAEVILRVHPVCPDLYKRYPKVNGTREGVRPASSPSMTTREGIPNEDVAPEDDVKKNWSRTKVNALIHLYEENKASFENNRIRRKDVWQKIAKKLNKEGGTVFSLQEVDKKWRNLKDRYKRIVDTNKQTGRGRSKWQYFDLMDQMLQKDPAFNPPCVAKARCSSAMENAGATSLTERSQEQTVLPVPSTSPLPATPASSKKRPRSNDDPPQWVIRFMEGAETQDKKARKLLKKVYKEKKKRNDLFERFLNMKCSNNDNNT